MKKFNIKLSPLILTLIFQGCMPDSLTKFSKDEAKKAATTTVVTNPSPTAPPDLTTLTSFQLKNITQKSTSYHLHKYGAGNSTAACEIPVANLGNGENPLVDEKNDILCWLEADEIQLFFNGTDFQANVPSSQCEYIQVKPYYFWNLRPKTTTKVLKTVTCAESNATCAALGGPKELGSVACYGDYTSAGGPNCDEGYVTVHSYSVSADVPAVVGPPAVAAKPGVTTFTSTTTPCGGKRTACYGGPGVDFATTKGGFPIPLDYLAYNGQSINYSVTAPGPLGKGHNSNHYISNYTRIYATGAVGSGSNTYDYTKIGTATGMGAYSKVSSVSSFSYSALGITGFDDTAGDTSASIGLVDVGMDPLKRADASIARTGAGTWSGTSITYGVQPFYEFSCLNYAHEVKGRIRVQIREWNQEFRTPVANYTEVSESAPARLLKQSANATDLETSGVGYWNDVGNWDTPSDYGDCPMYPALGYCVPPFPTVEANFGYSFPGLGF